MWSKIIAAVVVLIVASAGYILYNNAVKAKPVQEKPLEAERLAKNIMLYELNTESGKVTTLHAEKGMLRKDQIIDLFNVTVSEEDKFKITGPEATYNMDKSNLKVKGDILLVAQDGIKAFMKDMIWEKSTNLIISDNPVKIEREDGWLTGQKVEMTDDLSRISFSGGVHAKINRNIDING